ncbi:MAG: hypothetical protein K2P17_01275 [Helicobacteraceae bacterium]|nr:hypothetical protein [Helicobacteraceae bacterium]
MCIFSHRTCAGGIVDIWIVICNIICKVFNFMIYGDIVAHRIFNSKAL